MPGYGAVDRRGAAAACLGAYYRGHFDDGPVLKRVDAAVDFDWADGSPDASLDDDAFSVRWTGAITAPVTGRTTLAMRCATQCRILVSGLPVAQGRSDHEPVTITGAVSMRKGVSYPIRLELEHEKYDAIAQLLWETPGGRGDEIGGGSRGRAGGRRGGDGPRPELPPRGRGDAGEDRGFRRRRPHRASTCRRSSRQLLEKVVAAATGKPVVLVLLNGSALSIGWADRNVPAIVEAWYRGQAAGTAIGRRALRRREPGAAACRSPSIARSTSSRPSTTTR